MEESFLNVPPRHNRGGRRRRPASYRNRRQNLAPDQSNGVIATTDIPEEEIQQSPLGDLGTKTTDELRQQAQELGLKVGTLARRSDLVMALLGHHAEQNGLLLGAGVLDLTSDGYGFLRNPSNRHGADIYVSQSQVRRFGLRSGDMVAGQIRAPKDGERYYGLVRVEIVNGYDPETSRKRPQFEKLTPLFPERQIKLSTTPKISSTRLIDMVAPIGKGQRALIVSPPKAGKTIILKQIANGITTNHPEIYLIVALIGERPEEVTDMRRSVEGEIFSSTFDEPVEDHCRSAERALERAKRLVESGEDVVILLDSLTRLARAYNLAVPSSGRTLSGGMDPVALYPPKQFFGGARNCEEGGSLTIIATCLVDTGSRLDDLIYEEFKGTGNMEVHLDRKLADRRIFPAIDVLRSGTRREELLLDESTLKQVWLLRRMVSIIAQDSASTEATERVLERLVKTQDNAEFLASINKPGAP
ncbi:MAG: transcription termination factor Rho [Chloroflexi bacterium]|nr:transcription termination factor Rho [Chloroflexota bacterium]